jgi:hypothetical protein
MMTGHQANVGILASAALAAAPAFAATQELKPNELPPIDKQLMRWLGEFKTQPITSRGAAEPNC